MDKEEIKILLDSYRPQDAGDPIFSEALRAAAADPELAAWFEETKRFDAVMAAKFRELPVSPELRNQILQGQGHRAAPKVIPFPSPGARSVLASIAAMLVLGLFSWHFLAPRPHSMHALAMQAISYTGRMPALQFVCFDPAAVADWVNKQPGSQKMGLQLPKPSESLAMKMIGSSMVEWNGRPVVMVCLQNGKQMAMLYILKADDLSALKDGTNEIVQRANWVVRATKSNGQVRLLATRGGPEDLNFPMPF